LAADLEDLDASVRRHDPDRWLASRFIADQADRADVIALYAFNYEIARVASAVSNALMGEIRLTWWAEAVAEIFEGRPVRKHPVSLALAKAVERHRLSRQAFDAMIDARFPELDGEPVDPDLSEGSLMGLATAILGAPGADVVTAARVYAGQGARADANRALVALPVQAFPAVAYAALAGRGEASPLERRLRLTWAVFTGKI
jgi:phytoene synthase